MIIFFHILLVNCAINNEQNWNKNRGEARKEAKACASGLNHIVCGSHDNNKPTGGGQAASPIFSSFLSPVPSPNL